MAYYCPTSRMLVLETLITGTHSSGKTTDICNLTDSGLTEQLALPEPFGLSLQTLELIDRNTDDPDALQVFPVLTVGEAAMQYATKNNDLSLLGANYTMDTQREIEFVAAGNSQRARYELGKVMRQLKKDEKLFGNLAGFGVIVMDRGPNDGKTYSSLRTPQHDRDDEYDIPVREWWRNVAALSIDQVFITDPSNVTFEPGAQRSDDLTLRQAVHDDLVLRYAEITHNPLHLLSGTSEERKEQILLAITSRINWSFVTRSSIAHYADQIPH